MTNNTTSYGGDFTIKPLTTSINIITERQLLASWTRAGLTDGQIRKMLMLYLGEPAWMNLEKMYDCNMFNNIAEGLKFHSKSDFIEILIRCKGFGFVWKDDSALHNIKNLMAFYTPIWHQPAEGEMENMQDSQENMQSGGCYYNNNINKKKNIKKKNIINKDSAHQIANSAEYRQLVYTKARALLDYVKTNLYFQMQNELMEAYAQLRNEAVNLPADTPKGYVLVTYQQMPLGWEKNIGNRANNLYPQEWKIKSSHVPEEPCVISKK